MSQEHEIAKSMNMAAARLFSSDEGSRLLDYWIRQNIKNVASTEADLWRQQGVREFINSLDNAVKVSKKMEHADE